MRTWLHELWTDSAVFRSTVRAAGVTVGTSLLVTAHDLATWSGIPLALIQVAGVVLTGGSTAIPAGQQSRKA